VVLLSSAIVDLEVAADGRLHHKMSEVQTINHAMVGAHHIPGVRVGVCVSLGADGKFRFNCLPAGQGVTHSNASAKHRLAFQCQQPDQMFGLPVHIKPVFSVAAVPEPLNSGHQFPQF
jgi:hypothetical protein